MSAKQKILILRFSSIGDIVLTTPVARCIKQQIKDCEVHYATKPQFKILLESNPYVDKIHCLDASLNDLVKKLKEEKFDFIVDLHNNLRTRIIKAKLWNVQSSAFPKINWQKWLMVNFKINKLPNVHIVDRYFMATRPLGIINDNEGLDYFIPVKDEVENNWLPEEYRKEYYAFVIGAQFATKKLTKEKIISKCDQINKPIVLIGGPEDAKLGEEIERFFARTEISEPFEKKLKEMNKKTIVFNGCGKFNINQSADLLRNAKEVHTHDTGMMHIAAALKKNIVSYWGNTIPEFGMYPYKTNFSIIENKELSCRPCSKIGFKECPKGHFKCVNDL